MYLVVNILLYLFIDIAKQLLFLVYIDCRWVKLEIKKKLCKCFPFSGVFMSVLFLVNF